MWFVGFTLPGLLFEHKITALEMSKGLRCLVQVTPLTNNRTKLTYKKS